MEDPIEQVLENIRLGIESGIKSAKRKNQLHIFEDGKSIGTAYLKDDGTIKLIFDSDPITGFATIKTWGENGGN